MRQTLLLIPSSWFEGPLLIAWLVLGGLILAFLFARRTQKDALGFLPMYGIIAAVIWFVLPNLQIEGLNPADPAGDRINVGLAIRGYGFCMLLAMLSAVGLICLRCRQIGFDFDKTLSLVFWMIICGIAGARLFYIIQKWEEFSADSTQELLAKLVDMTRGGLVVYGSLIGGMLAATLYFYITKLPWRKAIDVIAPAMVLGLAIGRIGCLMNGCCYGGICDSQFGVQFPAGSPPYQHQLYEGRLLGVQGQTDASKIYPLLVENVEPESIAEKLGVVAGDRLSIAPPKDVELRGVHTQKFDEYEPYMSVFKEEGKQQFGVKVSELSSSSLKVHPTQIYSALNAFLLTAFLWFYFPYRRFDGEVFAIMIIVYPVARFILEAIRVDEGSQLNTGLTISQLVSIGLMAVGFGLWIMLNRTREPLAQSVATNSR